jgi:HPt (histidine-containing phosphotransfer) domain-containing protein
MAIAYLVGTASNNENRFSQHLQMNDCIDIDWEQLHQVSEDDPEFELELLAMLAEDVKIHIEDLHKAIVNNNTSEIASEAHYIKGASANVGITGLSSLAKQIEHVPASKIADRGTIDLVEQMRIQLGHLEAYIATR